MCHAGGDLAYIEAEIFGGEGMQAHVLVAANGGAGLVVLAHDAINTVLRSLGLVCGNGEDEFESLGLGRYRETDGWVNGCNE